MKDKYICPICHNEDPKYIGYKNGVPYCRRCISFNVKNAEPITPFKDISRIKHVLSLGYSLSQDQEVISKNVLENFKNKLNTFIYAVCGSGKTELVYRTIFYALKNNMTVGFCLPRRDVVIELAERLQNAFPRSHVSSVYGGHVDDLNGHIICLTSHQLYRYDHYFDLMIMDEIDAFPFKGDDVLNEFFFRSLKGNYILMSATPTMKQLEEFKKSNGRILTLFTRFHKHPLPVPEIHLKSGFLKLGHLANILGKFLKENKQVFIFVPTIELSKEIYQKLALIYHSGNYVNSKRENREKIIQDFKDKKYMFLVTTAVLERGVTVENLQVIIYQADSKIYDRYSLIQISGRAGRKYNYPTGEVIYIADRISEEMSESINTIKTSNDNLQKLF